MPRYSVPFSGSTQPLTSAHRQAVFLRNISHDQFVQLQSIAKSAQAPHIHPGAFSDIANAKSREHLIYGLYQESHARVRGEKTGGGLGSALNWVGQTVSGPFVGAWNFAQNAAHYFTHDNTISAHTRVTAMMIKQTYNADISARANHIGPYRRDPKYSTSWLDVWVNEDTKQLTISCRGSRDKSDFLIDDLGILTAQGPRDLVSSQLRDIFSQYDSEYDISVAGHSLGGSLLALALQNNEQLDPTQILFFNPGTAPIGQDAVRKFSDDDRAYFYMNAIDPVSMGALSEQHSHLILNSPQSWVNPIKNHTVDQWIGPYASLPLSTEQEDVQTPDDVPEDADDGASDPDN